jgi:hypothetical protein
MLRCAILVGEMMDAQGRRGGLWKAQAAVLVVSILLVGCSGTSDKPAEPEATAPRAQINSRAWTCDEPSPQQKGSLRFRVRAHDRGLRDEPWVLVRRSGMNFMAAEIDATEVNVPLVVLVSFPAKGAYLAGMKAVNGTARTFTDLPDGGNTIPRGAEQALLCMAK